MLPVNYTANYLESESSATLEEEYGVAVNDTASSSFMRMTIANVPKGSPLLWCVLGRAAGEPATVCGVYMRAADCCSGVCVPMPQIGGSTRACC